MYVLFFWLQSLAVGTPMRETITKAAISATPEVALDAVAAVLTPLRISSVLAATSHSVRVSQESASVSTSISSLLLTASETVNGFQRLLTRDHPRVPITVLPPSPQLTAAALCSIAGDSTGALCAISQVY